MGDERLTERPVPLASQPRGSALQLEQWLFHLCSTLAAVGNWDSATRPDPTETPSPQPDTPHLSLGTLLGDQAAGGTVGRPVPPPEPASPAPTGKEEEKNKQLSSRAVPEQLTLVSS